MTIVYESNSDNLRIEWNGQNTFNVYFGTKEINCFYSYMGEPYTKREAIRRARLWIIDNRWNGNI